MGNGRICVMNFVACKDDAPIGEKLEYIEKDGFYYLPMLGIVDEKPKDKSIDLNPEDSFGFYYKVDKHMFENINYKCNKGIYTSETQWGSGQDPYFDKELGSYVIEILYTVEE